MEPQAGGEETGELIQCWIKDMSKDSRVKGMGGAPTHAALGGHRAARRASWKRRVSSSGGLKNQQKPPVRKGRKEFQIEEWQEEGPEEGKADSKQEYEMTCRQ